MKKTFLLFIFALIVLLMFSGCASKHSSRAEKDTSKDMERKNNLNNDYISSFSEGLAKFRVEGKHGYINTEGEVVIQPQWSVAGPFHEGLAVIGDDDQYGYINTKGEVVIQPQWPYAGDFSEGLSVIGVGGKYGYINTRGEVVIQPQWPIAYPFHEGLAIVSTKEPKTMITGQSFGQFGFINKQGDYVIKPLLEEAYWGFSQSEGLIPVRFSHMDYQQKIIKSKYGYMNRKGDMPIEPKYVYAGPFSEGLAPVGLMREAPPSGIYRSYGYTHIKKYGYIDQKGRIVIEPRFNNIPGHFSEGLARVETGYQKVGFIDKRGEIKIPAKFTDAKSFKGGLAPAKTGIKWGYINKAGEYVIAPQFKEAEYFRGDFAWVELFSKNGKERRLIDKSGSFLADNKDMRILADFSGGLAPARFQGELVYIDRSGKVVIRPKLRGQ